MLNLNINKHVENVCSSPQAVGVIVATSALAGRRYFAGGFCKSTAFALAILKKNSAAAEWDKAGDAYLLSANKNFLNDVKVAVFAGAAAGLALYAKDNFVFEGGDQRKPSIDQSVQAPITTSKSRPQTKESVNEDALIWKGCPAISVCEHYVYPFYEAANGVTKKVIQFVGDHPLLPVLITGYYFLTDPLGRNVDRSPPFIRYTDEVIKANFFGVYNQHQAFRCRLEALDQRLKGLEANQPQN